MSNAQKETITDLELECGEIAYVSCEFPDGAVCIVFPSNWACVVETNGEWETDEADWSRGLPRAL